MLDQNLTINNLQFEIKKGQLAGIVGSTGIGKTSLVKLLLRLCNYETM